MKAAPKTLHFLAALFVTACLSGIAAENKPATPAKQKTPAEIEAEKQKAAAAAAEKQKKAEEAKKKAEAARKKAEEAKRKKEEALKKATDFKTWTARNFNDLKQRGEPMCIYIKDPVKDNKAVALFESADVLGSNDFRARVMGFMFSKLSISDKLAPSYPPDWVARAKKGAAVVIISGDLSRLVILDVQNLNPKTLLMGVDEVRKQQEAKQAQLEEKQKKEEELRKAKFAEEIKKSKAGDIPGLDKTAAGKKDKKPVKKPGVPEPVDE